MLFSQGRRKGVRWSVLGNNGSAQGTGYLRTGRREVRNKMKRRIIKQRNRMMPNFADARITLMKS